MKKNLKKISLKKTTVIVLNGKEKKQMEGGLTGLCTYQTCQSVTQSEPFRCLLSFFAC
jgi:hypothetical protein